SQAAHIIGGELTYICFGDDPNIPGNKLYLFTLTVYRDSEGFGADFDSAPGAFTSGTVSVFSETSGTQLFEFILEAPVEDPLDPEAGNPCVVAPPNIGVERGVYTFLRSLEVIDESYFIVYQRCCRNATINNIFNPGDTGSSYFVELTPTAQDDCNSSPVFKEFPPIVICLNEPLNFDHSANDAEGDQLIYEFCSPVEGGSTNNPAPSPDEPPPYDPVTFILPQFSSTAPLQGDPLITIDPFTGQISGTPRIQGQFVVGICVQEFRNGELLSTIQRDFQFNVTPCENLINAGVNGQVELGDTEFYLSCVDSTISFINQTTTLPGTPIFGYLWEFDITDPGTGLPLSLEDEDVTVTFPGPGTYTGSMTVNPGSQCSDVAFVNVTITSPIEPFFEVEYDTCSAGPVEFFNTTLLQGLPDSSWFWDFGDGTTSEEVDPVHQYQTPGLKTVSLRVTDTFGCEETIVRTFNWQPVPPVIIIDPSSSAGCPPEEVVFSNLSTPVDSTYDIIWDFGDGSMDNAISPTYTYMVPDTYTVSVEIISPIGCVTSDTFDNLILIDSLPIADFVYDPPTGISNFFPEVNFTDQSSNRAVAWDWKFGAFDSTIIQNPTYVFPDTGRQAVELVVTSFYGCQDTMVQIVDVEPQVTYYLPNAFTPNNDDVNDFFRGGGFFRGITNFQMQIFNRWGGVVFATND
ncbi:MAG: PKD domain-containing protein, partial [Bacteroidota bacterium]